MSVLVASLLPILLPSLLSIQPPSLPTRTAAFEEPSARISTIQLAAGASVREALSRDVDLDGVADLVIVASTPGKTGGAASVRRLGLHLRRAAGPAFVSTPDASLDLTADVVGFAIADVTPDAGREIVLFNAGGAYAWSPRASEKARIEKLVACEFLWQIPDPDDVFHWQAGIVDLDADGLEDLVLPAPSGYRIALQRRGEQAERFSIVADLVLPEGAAPGGEADPVDVERAEVRRPSEGQAIGISFASGSLGFQAREANRGPIVRVSESVPAARCLDWDGDGDLDLLALSRRSFHVFRQEPRGVFATQGHLELTSPVALDRVRALDVSYSARALDLDLDGRSDCLFFAGDKRSKDVRTQALVYLQPPAADERRGAGTQAAHGLFGQDGVPTQLLVIGGFARPLRPHDVDGDGRLDLVAGSVQPDLIDELRAVSTERIDAQLYVYRNLGRGFSKRPDLVRKLSIPARNFDYAADFVGDVNGDGTSELLLREEPDRVRLYPTRATREGLTVLDKPLWELAIDAEARLLLPGRLGPGSFDLWVIEKDQILCASFR